MLARTNSLLSTCHPGLELMAAEARFFAHSDLQTSKRYRKSKEGGMLKGPGPPKVKGDIRLGSHILSLSLLTDIWNGFSISR